MSFVTNILNDPSTNFVKIINQNDYTNLSEEEKKFVQPSVPISEEEFDREFSDFDLNKLTFTITKFVKPQSIQAIVKGNLTLNEMSALLSEIMGGATIELGNLLGKVMYPICMMVLETLGQLDAEMESFKKAAKAEDEDAKVKYTDEHLQFFLESLSKLPKKPIKWVGTAYSKQLSNTIINAPAYIAKTAINTPAYMAKTVYKLPKNVVSGSKSIGNMFSGLFSGGGPQDLNSLSDQIGLILSIAAKPFAKEIRFLIYILVKLMLRTPKATCGKLLVLYATLKKYKKKVLSNEAISYTVSSIIQRFVQMTPDKKTTFIDLMIKRQIKKMKAEALEKSQLNRTPMPEQFSLHFTPNTVFDFLNALKDFAFPTMSFESISTSISGSFQGLIPSKEAPPPETPPPKPTETKKPFWRFGGRKTKRRKRTRHR